MLSVASGTRSRQQGQREKAKNVRAFEKSEAKRVTAERAAKKKAVKTARREGMVRARSACKADKAQTVTKARTTYHETVGKARTTRDSEIEAARERCRRGKLAVQTEADQALEKLRQAAAEHRALRAELRRMPLDKPRRTAAEARSESDDEVRQNVPTHLLPLWEKVKRSIKPTDRWTRTEAFLHYVEEHPSEATHAIEQEVERDLRRLEREEREHYASREERRAASSPSSTSSSPKAAPKTSAQSRTIGMFAHEDMPIFSVKPKTHAPEGPRSKPRTYEQAKKALFDHLEAQRWTVARSLKTPHATSPDKTIRLFFHPQSVYFAGDDTGRANFGAPHSLGIDLREHEGRTFVDFVERWQKTAKKRAAEERARAAQIPF